MSKFYFKVRCMTLALHMNILATINKVHFLFAWSMEDGCYLCCISHKCYSSPFRYFLKRLNLSQHLLLMLNTIRSRNTLHSTLSKVLKEINVLGFSVSLSARSAETGKMGCRQLHSSQLHRKSVAQPRINPR